MRKLNEKEAVHCEMQYQFDKVNKILLKQFKKESDYITSKDYRHYGKDSVLCNGYYYYGYADIDYAEENGYKILSYSEFMGEVWRPKEGDDVWIITVKDDFVSINFDIYKTKYFSQWKWLDDCYVKNSMFRTRQLARDAKKAIQDALKKARKG